MTTFATEWAAWVARGPARPCLTWYGPGDDRIELSWATADNWANKVANLLVDGEGVAPGDPVEIRATGWLNVVAHLGAWLAGAMPRASAPVVLDDSIRDEALAYGDRFSGGSAPLPNGWVREGTGISDEDRVLIRGADPSAWLTAFAVGASVVLADTEISAETLTSERVTVTVEH